MTPSDSKPYHQMTPAERLADRIAKNRSIEERAAAAVKPEKKVTKSSRGPKTQSVLDKFQQIKRSDGIDAASEFVRSRTK